MILLICVILKNGTNELIYETKIESQCRKQTYGYQGLRKGLIGRVGPTYAHYCI